MKKFLLTLILAALLASSTLVRASDFGFAGTTDVFGAFSGSFSTGGGLSLTIGGATHQFNGVEINVGNDQVTGQSKAWPPKSDFYFVRASGAVTPGMRFQFLLRDCDGGALSSGAATPAPNVNLFHPSCSIGDEVVIIKGGFFSGGRLTSLFVQSADFAARCSAAGVLRCFGFDSTADLGGGAYQNFGTFNNSGVCNSSATVLCPTIDQTTGASGGSLKFVIPVQAGQGAEGQWYTNFSTDLLTQFGPNADFYIQWRQRFTPTFITFNYPVAQGWKQVIIGNGDSPGCSPSNIGACSVSCTTDDVVVQNTQLLEYPQMYNSCSGSPSHPNPYEPIQEPGDFGAGFDYKRQNARPSPYCLYSQGIANPRRLFPPDGNCFGYVANEWMTFQVHIHTGPWSNGEWINSLVELWVGRQGQPSELVHSQTWNLSAGANPGEPFGKIWLLPYHTNRDPSVVAPAEAYTWYDELIISRQMIADPSS